MIDEVYPLQQKRSMKYGWAMKMFGLKTGHLATESRKTLFSVISSCLRLLFEARDMLQEQITHLSTPFTPQTCLVAQTFIYKSRF